MELREFFRLFVVRKKLFFGIIFVSIIGGIIFFFAQPQMYKTYLLLNITRNHVQNTTDYTYDDFYRLQADERFADTVVRWVGAPHVKIAVFGADSRVHLSAKRTSSQVVEVTYKTRTQEAAQEAASALLSVINQEAENLNDHQKKVGWFYVIGSDPVIVDVTHALQAVLLVVGFAGFFIAFWAVLIVQYICGEKQVKK